MEVEAERRPVGGVVPLEVGHKHLELLLLILHLRTVVHHRARVLLRVVSRVCKAMSHVQCRDRLFDIQIHLLEYIDEGSVLQ